MQYRVTQWLFSSPEAKRTGIEKPLRSFLLYFKGLISLESFLRYKSSTHFSTRSLHLDITGRATREVYINPIESNASCSHLAWKISKGISKTCRTWWHWLKFCQDKYDDYSFGGRQFSSASFWSNHMPLASSNHGRVCNCGFRKFAWRFEASRMPRANYSLKWHLSWILQETV